MKKTYVSEEEKTITLIPSKISFLHANYLENKRCQIKAKEKLNSIDFNYMEKKIQNLGAYM